MKTNDWRRNLCAAVLLIIPLLSWGQQEDFLTAYGQNWQIFHQQGKYDEAVTQAQRVYDLGERMGRPVIMAYARNWEGQSLLQLRRRLAVNRRNAKRAFAESLELIASVDEPDLRLENLMLLRVIAQSEKDEPELAVLDKQIRDIEEQRRTQRSNQRLNTKMNLLDVQKDALEEQVESLNTTQIKFELLLSRQQNLLDSLEMVRMAEEFLGERKEMQLREQAARLELQERQIQLQASQRKFLIAMAGLLIILVIGGYLRYTQARGHNFALEAKNEELRAEREKSDRLLLNILPVMVAQELKDTGMAKARRYEEATVMFTDFKNFSDIAKTMSPELLVAELDLYFKAFDEIIGKYEIEKIKTIGDAYMCVGGLTDQDHNEPKDVVLAALTIQKKLDQLREERMHLKRPYFEARIGIHTGPLVAGVVGSRKFAYDIWGDTVNIAARMEASGEVGRVNISASTYALVKQHFSVESRGILPIKNRGEVAMFFIDAPADPLSMT